MERRHRAHWQPCPWVLCPGTSLPQAPQGASRSPSPAASTNTGHGNFYSLASCDHRCLFNSLGGCPYYDTPIFQGKKQVQRHQVAGPRSHLPESKAWAPELCWSFLSTRGFPTG